MNWQPRLKWQPRQSDIDWTRNHIDALAHNGLWAVPMNGSIWKLDKENKVFRLIHGAKDQMFEMVTIVCSKIGYTTEYAIENLPAHVIDEQLRGTGKSTSRVSNPGLV